MVALLWCPATMTSGRVARLVQHGTVVRSRRRRLSGTARSRGHDGCAAAAACRRHAAAGPVFCGLAGALAGPRSPLGKIADVGFIVVLFGAVWVRRFGPRGNALGMLAFISYFFALFLRARPGQIPVLAVGIAVGLGATLLVRTLIFPDRPRVEVRRLVRALRGASIAVLEVTLNRSERDLAVLHDDDWTGSPKPH